MSNARRVLVVEDEPSLAELARLYLERDGYVVDVAVDADAADRATRAHRPDVILLDIGLPGPRDGIDVVRGLRSREDWTPVIFVTARDDEVDRVLGLELGGDDYVTKPYSPRELVATEFDLLAHLLRRPGRVFGRAELLTQVWAYPADDASRTVDVHVAQLRAKLGDASPIRTVRGVGYAADDRA
jgi:DNA-binding response OmpR family regulator